MLLRKKSAVRALWRDTQAITATRDALIERQARRPARDGRDVAARTKPRAGTARPSPGALDQIEDDLAKLDARRPAAAAGGQRAAQDDARSPCRRAGPPATTSANGRCAHSAAAIIASERTRWANAQPGADEHIAALERRTPHRTKADALRGAAAARSAAACCGALSDAEAARNAAADDLARRKPHSARPPRPSARSGRPRRRPRVRGPRSRRSSRRAHAPPGRGPRIRESMNGKPEDCLASRVCGRTTRARPDRRRAQLTRLKGDRERLGGVNLPADEELNALRASSTRWRRARRLSRRSPSCAAPSTSSTAKARSASTRPSRPSTGISSGSSRTLFGGGEARLELIEGEDPLESGLEIIANPPGKKPATLSLLSGGEQTLTALSLIFAVFLTNPSPICVLDEVDAPLDDANVDRFCRLMEKMAERHRHALPGHHPSPDDHGAHEPAVRRHDGRARHLATGVGRFPAQAGTHASICWLDVEGSRWNTAPRSSGVELAAPCVDPGLRRDCWRGLVEFRRVMCAGGEVGQSKLEGFLLQTSSRRRPGPTPASAGSTLKDRVGRRPEVQRRRTCGNLRRSRPSPG